MVYEVAANHPERPGGRERFPRPRAGECTHVRGTILENIFPAGNEEFGGGVKMCRHWLARKPGEMVLIGSVGCGREF